MLTDSYLPTSLDSDSSQLSLDKQLLLLDSGPSLGIARAGIPPGTTHSN